MLRRPFWKLLVVLVVVVMVMVSAANVTLAQEAPVERGSPGWLLPVPEMKVDPAIPTLEQVVGHKWGQEITSASEAVQYARRLADAAPQGMKLVPYGESYEGRPLLTLVISAPENMKRLEEIQRNAQTLADPRGKDAAELKRLVEQTPAVAWLAYGVHGDESSSTDAALLTAYTLVADQGEATRKLLRDLVVVIDPMQNPDGRERFLAAYREQSGVEPSGERLASERTQRWAPGRFNHYLFDMNRDWFLQTQQETKARVAAYLKWQPQLLVDAHEMGSASNYYFDPPADPINTQVTPTQMAWFDRIGQHHGERFDQYGFAYTTREMYDAFYPGYGSTWPTLHGAIGILWEQAGVRGLLIDREDQTRLNFHDAVRHHYISGLATLEAVSESKNQFLADFVAGRGAKDQATGATDYFLLEGNTPARTARLAKLLIENGVEAQRLAKSATLSVWHAGEETARETEVPAGSYRVSTSQPAGRLARTLLDRGDDMGKEFIDRQLDRRARRLPDEIYDATAWSLPLTFGVEMLEARGNVTVESEILKQASVPGSVEGPERPRIGYLVRGEDEASMNALAAWLRQGLRVQVLDQPTTVGGKEFGRGALLVRTAENPETFHEAVRSKVRELGLSALAIDSSRVDQGAALGGANVTWVKPPKVVMAVGEPTGTSVGHTWYLFEQVWKYPVTRVDAGYVLSRLKLDDYDVLVLPSGSYGGDPAFGPEAVGRLKEWVRKGGTLVLVGSALSWATDEKVKLVPTERKRKKVAPIPGEGTEEPKKEEPKDGADKAEKPDAKDSDDKAEEPDAKPKEPAEKPLLENPDPVPGAFLRTTVYADHWVNFGLPEEVDLLMSSSLVIEPLKATAGRNLVTFQAQKQPVSGFCWPETLELLGRTPYVVYVSEGEGHIVGFTDDPNYRAQSPVTSRLFQNAVFFGPGH